MWPKWIKWDGKSHYANDVLLNDTTVKVTSHEKFSHNVTLEVKFSGKFQLFNVINRSIEMMKNSSISKNFILRGPNSNQWNYWALHTYVSGTKIFLQSYARICRHLPFKYLEIVVLRRLEMVQCKYLLKNL